LATARYATGWPARFHVVPNYLIEITLDYETGIRRYMLGGDDVSDDLLHIRYRSTLTSLHGEGPLEAVGANLVASQVLTQYAANLATSGGIPSSILSVPADQTFDASQASALQTQWVNARLSKLGEPAVLTGGVTWQAASLNPKDMALQEIAQFNDARIAVALGVPPFLAGLPSGAESYTYKSVHDMFDFHWRAGLRPKAQAVMSALSGWLLPRGTQVEVNRDAYVEPNPLERAQTYQVLASIVDPATGQQAMTVEEIRQAERLSNSTPSDDLAGGMLK
jgi:HK97 family phage portal protein